MSGVYEGGSDAYNEDLLRMIYLLQAGLYVNHRTELCISSDISSQRSLMFLSRTMLGFHSLSVANPRERPRAAALTLWTAPAKRGGSRDQKNAFRL